MVMLGVLALGVDLGQGYLQRRANQNAADAGSVAAMKALLNADTDQNIQVAIRHVLDNAGYSDAALVFLSPNDTIAGTDTSKVYVDAEYGTFNTPAQGVCTPLESDQWVGSNGSNPAPSEADCIRMKVSTSRQTFFGDIPLIGQPQIGASAESSAAQISLLAPGSYARPTLTPTPGAAMGPYGFGWAVWGGKRADNSTLQVGDPVMFFADSGWDYGNDIDESCSSSCEYNPNGQSYKGLIDTTQGCVMPNPPAPIDCVGPKGAHGNQAQGLATGSYVQVVAINYLNATGNHVDVTVIGWVTLQVEPCPSTPSYLQDGTNGVCGNIVHIDGGTLNENYVDPTPIGTATATPIGIGNVGSG